MENVARFFSTQTVMSANFTHLCKCVNNVLIVEKSKEI